ncbi:hypothetical protein [Natrarchaeobius oligotrophus]|uniref:hypothetical protein n=1 Tax=Natrarchaeobius oligotrophus TaxID=3455743 RepID=UPI000F522E1C|nr:hypothetical protein [Natrarchaeobius chitinivorans]
MNWSESIGFVVYIGISSPVVLLLDTNIHFGPVGFAAGIVLGVLTVWLIEANIWTVMERKILFISGILVIISLLVVWMAAMKFAFSDLVSAHLAFTASHGIYWVSTLSKTQIQ